MYRYSKMISARILSAPNGISEDFGVAFTLVNSGYARLYSKPFTALGNVTFLGQVMAAGGQLPTQWNEISIYNSADPSKYFKVSYGTFSQRLRFEDSGQIIEEIPWQAQPYYNWATYGLVFNGSEWAFFQNSSLVKLYQTSSMQGANSYYVGLGTWDAYSLNNFSTFDNVCIKATAAPEPVSTALFLLGGATLMARRLRRKV
jgi:hypothetical protein